MVVLLKNFPKIAAGPKAGLHSHLQDTFICIAQKLLRLLKAQGNHKFPGCLPKTCLEQAVALPLTDMYTGSNVLYCYLLTVMFLDIGQHLFDPFVLQGIVPCSLLILIHGPGIHNLPEFRKKASEAQLKKTLPFDAQLCAFSHFFQKFGAPRLGTVKRHCIKLSLFQHRSNIFNVQYTSGSTRQKRPVKELGLQSHILHRL